VAVRREKGHSDSPLPGSTGTFGARASDVVWRGRRIIGIFLPFLSAMSVSFSDVLIRRGALATARSPLASPTVSERVIC
jgi:hypothetical protein